MLTAQPLFQSVIAILIVLSAALYLVYKVIKKINHPVAACNGCTSGCSGCELTSMKKKTDKSKNQEKKLS